MKKFSLLLVTTILTGAPVLAQAEPYVGLGGGLNIGHERDITTAADQSVQYDLGWGALGTVGYKMDSGLRLEVELGYRTNGIDDIQGSPATDGDVNFYTLMGNVLYDFNVSQSFKPYIGIGAGAAWVEFDNVRTIGGSSLDDTEVAPAVQGIIGANYALDENWNLFTQYQYLYAHNVDPSTVAGQSADANLDNSLITVGVRYSFGKPVQAAPFVPAPAPAEFAPAPQAAAAPQKYMVFFDWNRADITLEAADILKTVAANVKNGKKVRLDLSGHADRSGPDLYNMKLSERRAEAVKKYLVRLGVSTDEIATFAKGENDPLVSTDDGVREPQNRRVEIISNE